MPPPSAAALELFKFAVYLSVPVALTFVVAQNDGVLQRVVTNRAYVVYPPEGPAPPTALEMRERVRARREGRAPV